MIDKTPAFASIIFAVCGVWLLSTACSREDHIDRVQGVINNEIVYVQDARTGLCFAVHRSKFGGMANVPCEKVKDQLNK